MKVRAAAGLLATLAVLGATFLLVRDSAFVEVKDVTVTGLTGPEAPQLRTLLSDAARDMTTLHVDRGQLEAIAEPYPVVGGLTISTDFPHGLRIEVRERTPVAAVEIGADRTLVAGDGTLLRGAARREVPLVPLRSPPGGDRVTERRAAEAIRALAAAPPELRRRIDRAADDREHGLVLEMADGPVLRFGSAVRLAAKWAATARVLADPSSRGATYLDVRYPERPAAGGLEDPSTQLDPDAVAKAELPQPETATTPQTLNP